MAKFLRWLGILLTTPLVVWATTEVNLLRLTQATAEGPLIKAYVHVRDGQGQTPAQLDFANLSVLVDSHQAKVQSVMPVSKGKTGTGYIFLVDVSGSLTSNHVEQIQAALIDWLRRMATLDRMALITFGDRVHTQQDFTDDQRALEKAIMRLAATDNHTHLYDGLMAALDLSPARRSGTDLPNRRAIIVLSDGLNDVPGTGNLEFTTQHDVKKKIQATHIPIYAVGFSQNPKSPKAQDGFQTLRGFAKLSGGNFHAVYNESRLRPTYAALQRDLQQAFVITANCGDCPLDGRPHLLQIILNFGAQKLMDSMDLKMPPIDALPAKKQPVVKFQERRSESLAATLPSEEPAIKHRRPKDEPPSLWRPIGWGLWLGIGVVAAAPILVGGGMFWWRRRKRYTKNGNTKPPIVSPVFGSNSVSPRASQKVRLTVVSGAAPGRTHDLYIEESATLGRAPECNLIIDDDPDISRKHCRIDFRDGSLFVLDLSSTHGTLLNGIRLYGSRPIEDGDKLTLGRTEVRLSLTGAT